MEDIGGKHFSTLYGMKNRKISRGDLVTSKKDSSIALEGIQESQKIINGGW